MKVKIPCGESTEEISDAEMAVLDRPEWAKKYMFFTHQAIFNFGKRELFAFCEFSTGCRSTGGILCKSRSEAILLGAARLASITEIGFLKAMSERPIINYEVLTEPPARTGTSENKPCAGPTS